MKNKTTVLAVSLILLTTPFLFGFNKENKTTQKVIKSDNTHINEVDKTFEKFLNQAKVRHFELKKNSEELLTKTKVEEINKLNSLEELTQEEKLKYTESINSSFNLYKLNEVSLEIHKLNEDRINERIKRENEEKLKEEEFNQKSLKQSNNIYQSNSTSYSDVSSSGIILANGNTAGEIGTYAAKRMEEVTGVSASTWEYIIARESNGDPNAYNPSGASGLFQTMPGWGDTSTVENQIQTAIRAYNLQGLSAWGM